MPEAPSTAFIADLFEAAVDPDGWPAFSDLVSRELQVENVGIWVMDGPCIVEMALTRTILESQDPYLSHFYLLDPWAAKLMASPVDTPMIGYEFIDDRQYLETEFYNDFGRHFAMRRPIGTRIDFASGVRATLSIDRPRTHALLEDEDKQRVAVVLPYLKRALQLRRRHAPQHANLKTAALDAISYGMIVADAAGRIVVANAAAERLAASGAGVTLGAKHTGLGAVVKAQAETLKRLVHDAATGGPGGALRLTDRRGVVSQMVLVTPLPRIFGYENGHALIALRPVSESPSFTLAQLSGLFGLSPAQAEIAVRLYQGFSVDEIAAERGVQVSTMRTHLIRIFQRTGAENQRDLIRLMADIPALRSALIPAAEDGPA